MDSHSANSGHAEFHVLLIWSIACGPVMFVLLFFLWGLSTQHTPDRQCTKVIERPWCSVSSLYAGQAADINAVGSQ